MQNIGKWSRFAIGLMMICLVGPVLAGECVSISEPKSGAKVQDSTLVEGTAQLPPGLHLWVLVGIAGTKDWWPQGGGEAEILGSSWEVFARFGREGQDWNTKFRLAAIVVTQSVHAQLEKWVTSSATAKSWDPITLPDTAESCKISVVKVQKKH